ncbi:MAG: hypothetical protein Q9174_006849 [Haloplaca sp. 1 TL-2023]
MDSNKLRETKDRCADLERQHNMDDVTAALANTAFFEAEKEKNKEIEDLKAALEKEKLRYKELQQVARANTEANVKNLEAEAAELRELVRGKEENIQHTLNDLRAVKSLLGETLNMNNRHHTLEKVKDAQAILDTIIDPSGDA